MRRPHGFRRFTNKQAFHSLYLVTTESGTPVKVGIAADPAHRFSSIQCSNFIRLRLHRVWWLAGRQISGRIEKDFKARFGALCVRGEWFEVGLAEAEAFIDAAVRAIGTWGVPEEQVVRLMDHYARQDPTRPPGGPSPLRGAPAYLDMGGAPVKRKRVILSKTSEALKG